MPTTSSVSPGAFSTICERYLPMPSCVIPRETFTPVFGTSANLIVSLGCEDETSSDDDDALGPRADADVAAQSECFGTRARVRDEERARDRGHGDGDEDVAAVAGEDVRDRGQHEPLADAIGRGVEECAE